MKTRKKKPHTLEQTELVTWFERDRAHVCLKSLLTEKTLVEWWDEAVGEAIEDGYLPSSAFVLGRFFYSDRMHKAAFEYYRAHIA